LNSITNKIIKNGYAYFGKKTSNRKKEKMGIVISVKKHPTGMKNMGIFILVKKQPTQTI